MKGFITFVCATLIVGTAFAQFDSTKNRRIYDPVPSLNLWRDIIINNYFPESFFPIFPLDTVGMNPEEIAVSKAKLYRQLEGVLQRQSKTRSSFPPLTEGGRVVKSFPKPSQLRKGQKLFGEAVLIDSSGMRYGDGRDIYVLVKKQSKGKATRLLFKYEPARIWIGLEVNEAWSGISIEAYEREPKLKDKWFKKQSLYHSSFGPVLFLRERPVVLPREAIGLKLVQAVGLPGWRFEFIAIE